MNDWTSLSIPADLQLFAVRLALTGVVVSALALLAARVLRRCSAPLRYGVLFAGVLCLLASPALVVVGQSFQEELGWQSEPATQEVMVIPMDEALQPFEPPLSDVPLSAPEASSPLEGIVGTALIIFWAFGALAGLARLLLAMSRQRRAIVGEPWSADWWTTEAQKSLALKVGMKTFPAVYLSPAAPVPIVLGFLRPTIVLPELAPLTWGRSQWEAVLLHEAAHIARRDPWAVLLQRGAVLLFWWCPLTHLVARRLNDLRETICDDYALEGPCDRIAYAELLVESAERLVNITAIPVPLALLDSTRGGLEARITRLLEKEKQPMTKFSFAGKLLGAAFLAATCLSVPVATALSGGQPPPEKKIRIKLIVDGKEIEVDALHQLDALIEKALQPKVERPGNDPSAKPDTTVRVRQVSREDVKPDPRIEELVRQAEAIKPGSGAEIRRMLQAVPKGPGADARVERLYAARASGSATNDTSGGTHRGAGGPPMPGAQQTNWNPVIGRQLFLLLVIENGNVRQIPVSADDLRKLVDKSPSTTAQNFFLVQENAYANPAKWTIIQKPPTGAAPSGSYAKPTEPKSEVRPPAKVGTPPTTVTPPVPSPSPNERKSETLRSPSSEVDRLRAQLERLHADVEMLRRRFEENKNQAK